MNNVPMTVQGAEKLREELAHLKGVRRHEVIQAIAEARAHGDLKENAEYHAAKEQQGFIEGRIQDLESKLASAQIIDVTKMSCEGRIIFGATVDLLDLETEENLRYQIVGDDEADVKVAKISVSSPIARALIGKNEGDILEVKTPKGLIEYEVEQVRYI